MSHVHPPAVPAGRASAGSPAAERRSDGRSRADGQPGAHSPGPWVIDDRSLYEEGSGLNAKPVSLGNVVAECPTAFGSHVVRASGTAGLACPTVAAMDATGLANARLVVAAPILLATAKSASRLLGRAMHELPLLGNQDVHSALCRALQELGAAVAVAEPQFEEPSREESQP